MILIEVITNLGLKNMYNSDRILITGSFVEKQKANKQTKIPKEKKKNPKPKPWGKATSKV